MKSNKQQMIRVKLKPGITKSKKMRVTVGTYTFNLSTDIPIEIPEVQWHLIANVAEKVYPPPAKKEVKDAQVN
jgi:hypothetical protein